MCPCSKNISLAHTQREKTTSRNDDRVDYSLQDIKSRWSFVTDVPSAFDMKFEVQLVKLPYLIACLPPRYFSHCVGVLVKYSSLPFSGRSYTNPVLFTKLSSPILPLAWWLNSIAHWATYLLTARSAMSKIKLTHTYAQWQRLSYFNVTCSGYECRAREYL